MSPFFFFFSRDTNLCKWPTERNAAQSPSQRQKMPRFRRVGVHDPGQAFVRVVDAEKPVPEMGQIESYSFFSQIVHFLDLRVSHGPRAIFGVECDRF